MNVYLGYNNTRLIPNDIVVSWVLRSDLVPVPRTIELVVQNKNGIDKELVEGAVFWSGYENFKYSIIKVVKSASTQPIQGDSPMQIFTVFAVLDNMKSICYRMDRAAILRPTTIGEMYRACGAQIVIEQDIEIDSFSCFVGQVPSYAFAMVFQEQCARALIGLNGKLTIARIPDLLKQKPKDEIGQADTTDKIDSEFIERHEIPSFYSIDENGSVVKGNFDDARQIQYKPVKSIDILNNMTKVLVTRRIVDSDLNQLINAGDVLRVNGKNYLVITAAHYAYRYDGIAQTGSKFWIGDLAV